MDGTPCNIYQESEESKSREVSYSTEDISSLNNEQNKNWSTQHKFY